MKELQKTIENTQTELLCQMHVNGYFPGRLCSSALSTATAAVALYCADKNTHKDLIENGLNWLKNNQNPDGAWGDTIKSKSNLSTTLLCYSALGLGPHKTACARAENWIKEQVGSLEPKALAQALEQIYGKDKSFSVPILTLCAITGILGPAETAWSLIKPLPFELAVLPQRIFKWLRLPVVSYALPALIAIGQAGFHFRKPKCPVTRLIRKHSIKKTLDVLKNQQPQNGGFLEAIPLTSFVVMSLAKCHNRDHTVIKKGVQFLISSVRKDGSWPIDTTLATWLTTSAVNAIGPESLSSDQNQAILTYLLNSQYKHIHPFTQAEPGAWAWSALDGAVPDADDTAGALIALSNLDPDGDKTVNAAHAGIKWLLNIQNRDSGFPTFCRGWSNLPFDRSCADITAHALAAMHCWQNKISLNIKPSMRRALDYLQKTQDPKGCWIPLWFGNESAPNKQNPVYGTSKVLSHLASIPQTNTDILDKAVSWLISVQNKNGSWSGNYNINPSIEETAVAVDALAEIYKNKRLPPNPNLIKSISLGTDWLCAKTKNGTSFPAAPIGLYFAQLWYYENLYPVIFTLAALKKVQKII